MIEAFGFSQRLTPKCIVFFLFYESKKFTSEGCLGVAFTFARGIGFAFIRSRIVTLDVL
jgi:hypothetical protein